VDASDLSILRAIQKSFPLAPRPYDVLAEDLGIAAEEVYRRVNALRRRGLIRRLGPLFSSRKLGFRGHLLAARVADDAVDRLARLLARRDDVTHNYLRKGTFNVWFTVMLPADGDLGPIRREVEACPGVTAVRSFPTVKMFKLDASFKLGDNTDG